MSVAPCHEIDFFLRSPDVSVNPHPLSCPGACPQAWQGVAVEMGHLNQATY
ncbi:MAG TPA: hypothetical protein V6C95_08385 [Coleofasciculaceae cyanobacterium]